MATLPPKAPPRFVPTLTDVVHVAAGDAAVLPASAQVRWPERGEQGPLARPAAEVPESFAPPLWSPQAPGADAEPSASMGDGSIPAEPDVAPAAAASADDRGASRGGPALPHGFEEELVHRVMQRVDVVLDQRLREAIATVVQEQTRSIVPRLREEVESVVRQSVYEAVADELSGDRTARM